MKVFWTVLLAAIVAGCTFIVTTRSSAECKLVEGCKAESTVTREVDK